MKQCHTSSIYWQTYMDEELNNICEECGEKDESVLQNLIKHGYKICDSCNISKNIFPV